MLRLLYNIASPTVLLLGTLAVFGRWFWVPLAALAGLWLVGAILRADEARIAEGLLPPDRRP